MSIDFQIIVLLLCITLFSLCLYMTFKARLALNGLARGVMLLLALLVLLMASMVIRRLDLIYNFVPDEISFPSIMVTIAGVIAFVVTLDVYYVYRRRDFFAAWVAGQKAREERLEAMRAASERGMSWDQPHYRVDI